MARTAQNSSYKAIENYIFAVEEQGGIYTNYPVVVNSSITANSINSSGAQAITSTSANSFAVGPGGATNPVFNVDSSTSSAVAGLDVVGAATGGTVAVKAIDTGSNTSLTLDGKGTGTVGINTVGTTSGLVTIGNGTSNAGLAVNGNVSQNAIVVPEYIYINTPVLAAATFAASTSYALWTAPPTGTFQVAGVSARYTAGAGSAATFQVEVAGAATAPGSGTAQNSTGVALNGTANTNVTATITTQTAITSASSVNLKVGGTATTSLVGLVVTVVIQRLT